MAHHVTLTETKPFTATRVHRRIRATDLSRAIGEGFGLLFDHAAQAGATPTGPPQVAYRGPFRPDGEIEVDLLLPTDRPTGPAGDADTVRWPGGPAARTLHAGPHDRLGTAYEALEEWVRAHGLRPAGPQREVYLVGPDRTSNPESYLTEVVMPVIADGE
ncbi:GyrI-like domain-containing protein [Actinosynnema sp. NPDC051121]